MVAEAVVTAKPFYHFGTKNVTTQDDNDGDNDEGNPQLHQVGGKALALIHLTSRVAGCFPVPPGFVLSTAFFEPWMNVVERESAEWQNFVQWIQEPASAPSTDADPSELRGKCAAIQAFCRKLLTFDEAQQEILNQALENGPFQRDESSWLFAVRSSSPEEDLDGTSFAGGYESTLAVPREHLERAILASFVSLFDERVVHYKQQHDMMASISQPRIAVIVQSQISSEVSGVAFSIHPQTNCYDEVLVNSSFGLGETVVAGQVTPDSYVVDKVTRTVKETQISQDKHKTLWVEDTVGGTHDEKDTRVSKVRDGVPEGVQTDQVSLTEAQAIEVADLAVKVETYYDGKPMDIEWAYDQGRKRLYLLQARPITAYFPLYTELRTKPGAQKYLYMDVVGVSQGFGDPMSPLGSDIWFKVVEAAKPSMRTKDPTNSDNSVFICHGKMYGNCSTMAKSIGAGALHAMMGVNDKSLAACMSPDVLREYVPSRATMSSTMAQSASTMFWGTFEQLPKAFGSFFFFESSLAHYVDRAEHALSHMRDLRQMLSKFSFPQLVTLCLADLAKVCESIGFITCCLYAQWRLTRIFKSDHDQEQDAADQYLQKLQMDLPGNPTSRMGHQMCALATFDDVQNCENGDAFAEMMERGTASAAFQSAYDAYMTEFGCRCIREIEIATPRAYESPAAFWNQLRLIDLEHNAITTVKERRLEAYNALLEMAKRRGQEAAFQKYEHMVRVGWGYREHPKFIIVTIVDLLRRKALALAAEWKQKGRLDDVQDVFDLSLDELVAAERDSGLDLRGPIEAHRKPRRTVARVKQGPILVDSRGRILREPRGSREALGANEVPCDPISPGVARGRANILHSPYQKPLHKGEILVTHATDPGWTPIFINAAAVVLEVGGSLQHGAVIAREYGLPCVSGLAGATTHPQIKDGQLIEVDGTRGIVRILSQEKNDGEDGKPA